MTGEPSRLRTIASDSGDAELFPEPVLQLYDRGQRQAALALLRQVVQLERDPARRALQTRYARDAALWADPSVDGQLARDNPVVRIYAGRAGPDGIRVGVRWLTALWIPLLPLTAHRVTATASGWRLHGRVPIPRWSWLVPLTWALACSLVGLGVVLPVAFLALARADLVAYNGFDVPVEVTVGDARAVIAAGGHARFDDLEIGELSVSAIDPDGRIFDSAAVDLRGHAGDLVLYNVAARGLLLAHTVRYSDHPVADAPADVLLPPQRILYFDEPFDYLLEAPPTSVTFPADREYVDRRALLADELPEDADPYELLLAAGEPEHALALVDAELALHPDDPVCFRRAAEHRARFGPDAGPDWIRTRRDLHPDDFEAHRTYQDFAPIPPEALAAEYDAMVAAAPDSVLARTLAARARMDTPEAGPAFEAVLETDPTWVPAVRELGGWRLRGADWDGAQAMVDRLAELGEPAPGSIRLRLAWALGRELPVDEETGLGRRAVDAQAVRRKPSEVDAVVREMLARMPTLSEGEASGLEAAFRLQAGDLASVRALLPRATDPWPTTLLLGLSDGATGDDRARALRELPEPDETGLSDRILAWTLVAVADPARRSAWDDALPTGARAVLPAAATDPALLSDPARVDAALAYRTGPEERAAVYAALAVLATDPRVGATWRDRAGEIGLPWELPWFRD